MSKPDRFARELLAAALAEAAKGRRVHPLRPGSKLPLLEEWQVLATTSKKQIRKWWSKYPHANIGVATGRESNLWVLDVDTKEGKRGVKSFRKLVAEVGAMPRTEIRGTPSGGIHYLFSWPKRKRKGDTWRNSATYLDERKKRVVGPLYPDLDVRAEGGYIAVAPSRLAPARRGEEGPSYTILKDRPLARVPAPLAAKTKHVPSKEVARPSLDPKTLSIADNERLSRWLLSATNGVVDDLKALQKAAVRKGEKYKGAPWNVTSFEKACRLIELASAEWSTLMLSDAYDLFFTNAPRDKGFTDETVSTIWSSATKRIGEKQLPIPDIIADAYMVPLVHGEECRADPDSFFQKGEGLLAEKLVDAISENLGLGPDRALWAYRGGVWRRDEFELMRRVARLLGDRYRPAHTATARDVVSSLPDLPLLGGDPTPDWINLRSGMLDWRTATLVAHDPSYLSTVQLPVDWEPGAECPRFERWLSEVIPADSLELAWEIIGYMLLSGNPFQKAVLFYGEGGNGKGTLLRVLARLLGVENVSSVTLKDLAEGKFEVAELYGKIANLAGDIDPVYLKHSAQFKAITGRDLINAQRKYGHPFSFTAWATPIFSANEFWRSADTTEGYFRRWIHLPFPTKVAGGLDEETLVEEVNGIVAKAIPALQRLMARGRFELGLSAQMLADDFREQSDLISVWVKDDDRISQANPSDSELRTERGHLYGRFKAWAIDSGHAPISATKFYSRLEALSYVGVKVQGTRYIAGIKLDSSPLFMPIHHSGDDD